MRESLVGLGHLVGILALFDRGAEVIGGIHDLAGEALSHGLLAAVAGISGEPPQPQGLTALRPNLDGHLVSGAAHAAGLDLQGRHDVLQSGGKDLQRVFPGLFLDDIESTVDHFLRDALLTVQHDAVDQLGHQDGVIQRVGQNLSLGYVSSSGHFASLLHSMIS